MNKREGNKIEEHRRQQIFEILDLCLRINGLQKSNQKRTGNHPTAFFKFSGHAGVIDVCVHENGWDDGEYPDRAYHAYIDQPEGMEELIEQLKKETPGAATPRAVK